MAVSVGQVFAVLGAIILLGAGGCFVLVGASFNATQAVLIGLGLIGGAFAVLYFGFRRPRAPR